MKKKITKITLLLMIMYMFSISFSNVWVYAANTGKGNNKEVKDATSYTVNFELNGGTGEFKAATVERRGSFTIPKGTPEKAGYLFLGWNLDSKANPLYVRGDKIENIVSNHTLHAVWQASEYKVTFKLNGGIGDQFTNTTVTAGEAFTIPTPVPTRSGYDFAGWYTDSEFTGNPVSNSVTINNDTIFYAKWKKTTTNTNSFTIDFDLNGGTGEFKAATVERRGSFTIPKGTPEKAGHLFLGWKLDSKANTLYVRGDKIDNIVSDHTLHAVWQVNEYKVMFKLNGGIGDQFIDTTVAAGEEFTIPTPVPTREGYDFAGWYNDPLFKGDPVTTIDSVTKDVMLYAKWEVNKHTIKFDLKGGTDLDGVFDPKGVGNGEDFKVPTNIPSYEGNIFRGWYYIDNGISVPVQAGGTIAAVMNDITLHAEWLAENYAIKVTFDVNGGVESDDFAEVVLEWRTTFNLPTVTPERAGYEFVGWSANPDSYGGLLQPGAGLANLERDVVLTAQWEAKKHTIEYDLKGGTDLDEVFTSKEVEHGKDFKVLENIPSYEGNIFRGWYYSDNGISVSVQAGETIASVMNDITLHAEWLAENYAVKVTFDLNGGLESDDFAEVVLEWRTTFNLPTVTPERAGYEFVGWLANPDSYGGLLQPGAGLANVERDVVLTAQWEKTTAETNSFTIDFDLNGGTGEFESVTVERRGSFTIPKGTPERAGHLFLGWNLDSKENTLYVRGDKIDNIVSNHTLHAVWQANEYKVTFKLNGGIGDQFTNTTVTAGEEFTIPTPVPTKAGYDFVGWYTDSAFTGNPVGDSVTINDDTIFYAKWKKTTAETNSFTMDFDLNGGTGEFKSVTVERRGSFAIPKRTPEKAGHLFLGWNLDDKADTLYVRGDKIDNIVSNHTLHAVWQANEYKVMFKLNGGTGKEFTTATVAAGDDFIIPTTVPTRDGHKFAGWYLDKNLTNKAPATITNIEANITLHAKWEVVSMPEPDPEVVKYTVSFDLNGGTGNFADMLITKGASVVKPTAVPTKAGYKFVGWFTEKEGVKEVIFPLTVEENIILFAHWEKGKTDTNNSTPLNNNGNSSSPSTGDSSAQNLFFALFILSLTGAVGISISKKAKQK